MYKITVENGHINATCEVEIINETAHFKLTSDRRVYKTFTASLNTEIELLDRAYLECNNLVNVIEIHEA